MLFAAQLGGLELRHAGGAVQLRGTFPYATEAELAPGRAETFAPRAFAGRLEGTGDIHLLIGHDWGKPLASRAAGTLTLRDTPEALELVAEIAPDLRAAPYVRDFLAASAAGLVRGLSPGFRVQPGGERIEARGNGLLRTVTGADLFELSAVTRPAYGAAQVEARSWAAGRDAPDSGLVRALQRWRA